MGSVNLRPITWVLAGLMSQPSFPFFQLEEQEGEKIMSGHSGQLSVNNHSNVWRLNSNGWFKIKYMISCISTSIPLIYNGILQYWLGFGFHTPQAWRGFWECMNSNKTTWSWTLKLPETVTTLLVGEITDRIHSENDSLQCVPSEIVLNALCVMTVCQCDLQLLNAPLWHGNLARVSRRIYISLLLLPPEMKKKTSDSRD